MSLSKVVADALQSKQSGSSTFKQWTPEPHHIDELIQEANKGDLWAQYYIGMSFIPLFL